MRTSIIITLCLASISSCTAFTPYLATRTCDVISKHVLSSSSSDGVAEAPLKKKLTAADILARARKAVGKEDEEEIEREPLFSESLMDDMRACLLTLEKRVKGGPGSIQTDEVSQFEAASLRIINDMNLKLQSPSSLPQRKNVATATSTAPSDVQTIKNTDYNEEEGAAFDGTGGLGLAKDTANTWVLPGMAEMSGEEYRTALQKSVSDRQAERRKQGLLGNRIGASYLDGLKTNK